MKRAFLWLIAAMLLLSACAPAAPSLKEQIQGSWKNPDGFSIQFREDGTGFIPGVAGAIPDSSFHYTIVDESHITIDLEGQNQTIEIAVAGDKLTWKDDLGQVDYTRLK